MPDPPLAPEDPHAGYEGLDGRGNDLGRLLNLSDGIFAFSLTFLVVSLVLPAPGATVPSSLSALLVRLEPGFLAYILSFVIVSTWWDAHHRLFSPIQRYDWTLLRLNTFFLLVISITPFLVALLFDYGPGKGTATPSTQLAIVLYAGVQAVGGGLLLGIWRHATRGRRLVRPDLPDEWIRGVERSQLAAVAVFLASMPIAVLSPLAAELVWVLMVAVRGGRGPFRRRRVVP